MKCVLEWRCPRQDFGGGGLQVLRRDSWPCSDLEVPEESFSWCQSQPSHRARPWTQVRCYLRWFLSVLDVAFINTSTAKLSCSPSKVTLDDFLLLYPLLGRVCHPREAERREQERFCRSSGAVAVPVFSLVPLLRAATQRSLACLEKGSSAVKAACIWN